MILDDFAGPGGWDQGLAMIGRTDTIGIEWDAKACETAHAAGHLRVRADVAVYPSEPFTGLDAYFASPPCQAWSMAGNRKGELDRANCHRLADRMSKGDDSLGWTEWEDPRSALVCQPIRRVRDLMPLVVALEEVPPVRQLWEHFAHILRGFGYNVWTGILCAADYGVPQTRRRCILMAALDRPVNPPVATHSERGDAGDLFGAGREKWVSMATALGWDLDATVTPARGAGMTERHGDRNPHPADGPSPPVISKSRSWVVDRGTNSKAARGGMEPTVGVPIDQPSPTFTGKVGGQWVIREADHPKWFKASNQDNAAVRHVTAPAPTILFGHASNSVKWFHERPATTVVGSFNPDVIAPPGYRTEVSRQNAEGGVKVTVAEGGVLQSFPADYPWQGSRTKQYEQVGNAIPPLLAAHIGQALGLGTLTQESAA